MFVMSVEHNSFELHDTASFQTNIQPLPKERVGCGSDSQETSRHLRKQYLLLRYSSSTYISNNYSLYFDLECTGLTGNNEFQNANWYLMFKYILYKNALQICQCNGTLTRVRVRSHGALAQIRSMRFKAVARAHVERCARFVM